MIFSSLNTDILAKFKYILVEFHFNSKFADNYSDTFKNLNQTHHAIIVVQ